jgi:hypothetical protein
MSCNENTNEKGFKGCPCSEMMESCPFSDMKFPRPSALFILTALSIVALAVWVAYTWPWIVAAVLLSLVALVFVAALTFGCPMKDFDCCGGKKTASTP